ncbi:CPBP family intramembrane glutamic endopeptidase [Halovenus marina]|uniref:CPBP family intramembrane glutamic endopeptidase n=1 Tax=Halovenus marina TaxID=3396621 RepID=UPI003F5562CD
MPAWGAFLAVAAVLTALVVFFSHVSANTLDQFENGTAAREPIDRQTGDTVADSPEEIAETPPATEQVELTTGVMFANVVVTQGAVVVILAVAAWYFSIPSDALGLSTDIWTERLSTETAQPLGLGVVFGLVLWVGNELSTRLADAVGAAYDESVRELLAPDSVLGWIGLLGVVLPLVAISEELLFRGALVGVAAAGTGISAWLFAIVSSLAFALGHGAQGRVGVVVTGALGFVLAAGYVLSASLLLVVVAHYVVNAMEFLVHETRLDDHIP